MSTYLVAFVVCDFKNTTDMTKDGKMVSAVLSFETLKFLCFLPGIHIMTEAIYYMFHYVVFQCENDFLKIFGSQITFNQQVEPCFLLINNNPAR